MVKACGRPRRLCTMFSMNIAGMFREIPGLVRELGAARAGHTVAYRALQRACDYHALVGVVTELSRLRYGADQALDPGYRHGFLEPARIRELARDPAHAMEQGFVDEVLARGDRCYAIFDGDALANYCWYARHSTPLEDDLILHFDSRYVYVYKCWTMPAYRGRRLHGIGMSHAVRELARDGCQGIIAWVESTNYRSLSSGARMGHEEFGVIRYAKIGSRYRVWADRGCRDHGFRLEPLR